MNILILFIIGISLSMDTFSLALSMGAFNINKKKILLFSCLVGIFHFIMPLLGLYLGSFLTSIISLNPNRLLFFVFTFIAIEMLISLFSKEEKILDLSFFSSLLLAFSVSIDSFTVGIVLRNITDYLILPSIIFMFVSFIFTFTGLHLGKYSYEKMGFLSKIIGLIIIIILAIIHLFK